MVDTKWGYQSKPYLDFGKKYVKSRTNVFKIKNYTRDSSF